MSDPLRFELSPTQSEFAHADEEIIMLIGPMGEGKTFCGIASLLVHAARCGRNIRGALIRDTHQNIKISTIPDIQEALGNRVTFHDDYKKMIIHTTPRVEMDLFGIDDPASLSKLQGPQYAIIWLEEPAPIIEKASNLVCGEMVVTIVRLQPVASVPHNMPAPNMSRFSGENASASGGTRSHNILALVPSPPR